MSETRRATYEELLQLALERGFFFPSAEIYNDAPAGFWEYGPNGLLMRNNFVRQWRKDIVRRDDMLEIDGSVIMPKVVFESSGHLSSLVDPIVECNRCHTRIRADKYISEKTGLQIDERLSSEEFQELISKHNLRCPKCGGDFGKPSKFNMMFRVGVGAENTDAYLRPETAQSIFVDFARLSKTMRMKLPEGVAQVGKSFRNEIAPRQGFIRLRELTQAEAEIFFNPGVPFDPKKLEFVQNVKMNILRQSGGEELGTLAATEAAGEFGGKEIIGYYFALLQRFYENCGFPRERTRFRELSAKDRAFYTTSAFDFEVDTSVGWLELVACNYRTDYDLGNHARFSKKDLQVMDGDRGKVLPHVIELSLGVDRSVFALLDLHFVHEQNRDVLRLRPNIAPYLSAIFPLVSKPELESRARALYEKMRDEEEFATFYDDSGAIGRRYRRMDEIGTPYCITVDHQSVEDGTATLRERDSMSQSRVALSEIPERLRKLRDNRE